MKIIERDELETLVPHKGKMFLLDRVIDYDTGARTLCSEAGIKKDMLFFDENIKGVPCFVCFEFMAQSIAALSGIIRRGAGEDIKLGFVLSVSDFSLFEDFVKEGAVLTVKVKEDCALDLTFTYRCETFLGAKKIADALLTVIEMNDEDAQKL